MMKVTRVIVAAALVCGDAHIALGQSPVRNAHSPACTGCSVQLAKVATVGSATDSVLAGPWNRLARDSRGRFYATSYDRFSVVVYDPDGKYLTSLGRRGQGPGETAGFGVSHIAVGKADSLFVFQTGRVNVFTPALVFARSFRLPTGLITSVRPLSNGTFVVGATYRTPEHIGYAYHILDGHGNVVRSFGDAALSGIGMPPARSDYLSRTFALNPDERSLWITPFYRLREVPLDGSPGRQIDVVDSPWILPGRDTSYAGRFGQRVTMKIGRGEVDAVGMTAPGLLWIAAMTPSPSDKSKHVYGLDVVDIASGRVLVSRPLTGWLSFLGDDLAYSTETNGDGVVSFSIWRVTFQRSTP